MIKLKQAVIVEGKYDKIKLQSVIEAVIITTDGFRIYKDREKMDLIRTFARKDGIIILTDSDHAGFQIRNHLKGSINDGKIYNIYIPDVFGKEKRKERVSAENKLGVEGIDTGVLENAFKKYGIIPDDSDNPPFFTRAVLFDDGLIGAPNSAKLRRNLAHRLDLPENLSVSGLIEVLNTLFTPNEYKAALAENPDYNYFKGNE